MEKVKKIIKFITACYLKLLISCLDMVLHQFCKYKTFVLDMTYTDLKTLIHYFHNDFTQDIKVYALFLNFISVDLIGWIKIIVKRQ